MAIRIRVLKPFDVAVLGRAVVVAYPAGWSGLVPAAHAAAAPPGAIEELPRHGPCQSRADARHPEGGAAGDP